MNSCTSLLLSFARVVVSAYCVSVALKAFSGVVLSKTIVVLLLETGRNPNSNKPIGPKAIPLRVEQDAIITTTLYLIGKYNHIGVNE